MESASQIYYFFCCLLCGAASGVVYDFIYVVKQIFSNKKIHFLLDIIFFFAFSGMYIFTSVMFELPSFRLYMFIGCLIGLLLYLKSMHRMLAFFVKRLYNIVKNK